MKRVKSTSPVAILGTALLTGMMFAGPAHAASQSLLLGGAQYSGDNDYVYLGALKPIAGGKLGDGFYVSPFLGVSHYTFTQNNLGFTGNQPAVSLGVGYAWTRPGFSLSLSLAGGYADTFLSPYKPSGSIIGGQLFAEPEIYTRIALPGNGSVTINSGYLAGIRSFFGSVYSLVPVNKTLSIGPEVDFGGGINYRDHSFALRIQDQLTSQLTLTLSAGASTNVPVAYKPYVAFTFSLPVL